MRYLAVVLALSGCQVSGCASQWVKAGGTQEEFRRDLYECQKDAAPVQYMPRYNRMVDDCLRVKGWHEL